MDTYISVPKLYSSLEQQMQYLASQYVHVIIINLALTTMAAILLLS